MRILIACEFSGTVRDAFLKQGHDAISCDLLPTERPGPHYQGDVKDILTTESWDLLIAHPPCTYMANSGVSWLNRQPGRWAKLDEACEFFKLFLNHPCPKIAVENPIPHKYAIERIGRKYDQIIQPWQFGHPESKATCLWLKNLPQLVPTNILPVPESGRWENQTPSGQNRLPPSEDRWKLRSITYQGIADGMAAQWNF